MRFLRPAALLAPILATLALGACVAPPAPPPPPSPVTAPPPPPPAPEPELSGDWLDWPMTPGNWSYRAITGATVAQYGPVGAPPLLTIRCNLPAKQILFLRDGLAVAATQATLRTTFGETRWPVTAGAPGQLVATRPAADAGLDQIAFSRGRFTVEIAGAPPLVLPAWAEVARVIEDCRT